MQYGENIEVMAYRLYICVDIQLGALFYRLIYGNTFLFLS